MIYQEPTIYTVPNIYAKAGGGGGEPVPDPLLYKVYLGLQIKNGNSLELTGLNFPIKHTDKIKFDINYTGNSTYIEFFTTNGRMFGAQKIDASTLRVYGWGGNENMGLSIPGWYKCENQQNDFIINGIQKNIGNCLTGSYNLKYLFTNAGDDDDSVIFDFVVKDENDEVKFKFLPALRISDSKKGMIEIYTNTFVPADNQWKLLMG